MDDCTRTLMQQPSMTAGVAQALGDVESVPSCNSPVPPSNVPHDTEPSSDAERAADATNEPRPGGSPNAPSKSTLSDTPELVFDLDDGSPSSATSDYTDDRDDESLFSVISEDTSFDYKHGRRYPASHQYCWPNDRKQNKTLDILHHAFCLLLEGSLYLAPLGENVQNVLDVGTGTGIWAIDFADEHSGAHVIGNDISPIQPEWVPPNLEFLLDDCNLPWDYRDTFDFIHARLIARSIANCDEFMKQGLEALKPGGYFECHEISMRFKSDDGTLEDCNLMKEWGGFWGKVGVKSKRPFTIAEDGTLKKSMELAGFTDIKEYGYKMPVGGWAKDSRLKEVGQFTFAALCNDLEGFVLRPAIEVLGWSWEEAILFAAKLRTEMRSGKAHAYIPYKVVVGRKPN